MDLNIINFANVSTPSFENEKIDTGLNYVKYGDNNLFPQELLQYSDKSVTHSACLKLKTLAIGGEGFEVQFNDTKKFLESLDFETDNSTILEKISNSLAIFDGFALEVIWNRKGDKITNVYYIPFENLRAERPDRYGNVKFYYYNSNWEFAFQNNEKISRFDPLLSKEYPKQILYFGKHNSKSICYPIPTYASAINYIVNEYELSLHYLSCSVNSFSPSMMMSFIGNYTPEEKKDFIKQINDNYKGNGNSNKLITNFIENETQKPIVETIQVNNVVDMYLNSSMESKNQIITANQITSPALISVSDSNSSIFSNGDELKTSWNIFQKTTIKSYQILIEKCFNIIIKYSGYNDNYKIIPFKPIDDSTDNTIN